jgi:tetratricopeptide (TPR) repeat protein
VEMKQPVFTERWITVKTAEENWPVNSLLDFWIWIGQHMAAVDPAGFGALGDLGSLWSKDEEHEQCFITIEARLKGAKKKLLMLVDNVGDLFRKFSKQENHALRELLVSNKHIKLIGGTAVRLDELETHDAPYFDLFKEHHLVGLNQQEVIALLQHYARKSGSKHVEEVVKKEPHRVDHLRILTGGVPRTIMLLLDVFDKDGDASVFNDLRRTLDLVTPLYKHRMDELSPQKQKIVHALAMNWDGMSSGEIGANTRLESKMVSAQLGQLVRDGFVLREETSTKNHFYQLAERFFNIWYLMNNAQRNGAAKVRWLTRFFELWCDERGLRDRAIKHANALERTGLSASDQLLITNALLGSERLDLDSKQLLYERSLRSFPDQLDQLLPEANWKTAESKPHWRLEVWWALERLDLEQAEKMLAAKAPPSDSWTWIFHGDIAMLKGKLPEARMAFEQGLRMNAQLAQVDPANTEAKRNLSISHDKLADLLIREGKLSEARKSFEQSLRMRAELAESDPTNAQAKLDLSISHDRLGDLLVREGKLPEARKFFEQSLRISAELAETDPTNAQANRNLSVSRGKLGNLFVREGKPLEARKFFEQGLQVSADLAESDPTNAQAKRDLSISHERLGELLVREGKLAEARKHLEQGLRIRRELAEEVPTNALAKRDLSVSYNKLGDLLVREGELTEARKLFEQGLRISAGLAEVAPTNAEAKWDLAWSHWYLLRTAQQDEAFAKEHSDAYSRIVDAMAQQAVAAWKRGELEDAFSRTIELTGGPISTTGVLEAFLWGLVRQQYHGFRELFEERFPHLKTEYRPMYFALLRMMKKEDPDSYRRMGKELEEPVQQILARVEEMRKELNSEAKSTRTVRKKKSSPHKTAKPRK